MAATIVQSWNVPYSGSDRKLLRFLPCLTDLAFLIPIFFLLVALPGGASDLLGDADTAWHIRTGEWILQHGAVPHVDLFSFTKAGQPWFAWEWGWDVLFALVHQWAGLAGIIFVNLIILCFASALLYRLVRRACDHDVIAFAVTVVALCASMIHWLARPHLSSWIFFLLLLHILDAADRGHVKVLRWTPLLLLVWTNIHGSFFLGVLMIGIAAFGKLITPLLQESADWKRAWNDSRSYWAYMSACVLVTFINPYGWHVHQHIVTYLRSSKLMDQIQEFQSISFHHGPAVFFEVLLLCGVMAAVWCIQRRQWATAIGILLWAHFGLVAARNIPLYVFVASPAAAAMLVELVQRMQLFALLRKPASMLVNLTRTLHPFERVGRWHLASLLLVAYVGCCFAARTPGFEAKFPKTFPVTAVDAIRQAKPTRIFSTDQWGDFLIYHFYPSTKVFVDGRSDMYGFDFLERCNHILGARWDWEADLQHYLVDMVVITPDTPLATVLKTSAHWRLIFDDGSVAVFGRTPGGLQAQVMPQPLTQVSAVARNGGKNAWGRSGLQVNR